MTCSWDYYEQTDVRSVKRQWQAAKMFVTEGEQCQVGKGIMSQDNVCVLGVKCSIVLNRAALHSCTRHTHVMYIINYKILT